MRELSLWCILICIGCACASPYYYRESKHHAEHHKEYSYGNGESTGQIAESFPGEEEKVPEVSTSMKPERYSSYLYPSHGDGYRQSHSGGYSFSQGSRNAQQYSLQPTYVSSQLVQQSAPVVVKHQKIVRVYSYPSTSTHSGYYQFSRGGYGSGESYNPTQSERHVSGGEESLYSQQDHSHGDSFGQKESSLESLYGQEGQSELNEEFGPKPNMNNLEIGQKEVSIHSQSGQSLYGHHQSGNTELGQKEESLGHMEFGQREEPVPNHHYKPLQGYSPSGVEVGQKEESSRTQSGQSLYTSHHSSNLELGQKEESLGQMEFGQREEQIPTHNYKPIQDYSQSKLEVGQKEESLGQMEFGQREEPVPNPHYKPLQGYSQSGVEVGQKEESSHTQSGQSLYTSHHSSNLELGQKEESLGQMEFGQREEQIPTHNYKPIQDYSQSKLEVGQKEESLGQMEFGQKEEPVPNHHYKPIRGDYSQSELEVGQKEESLYEIPQKEEQEHSGKSLYDPNYKPYEDGQKEESLGLGDKEKNVRHTFHSHHTKEESYYQKHESGQREGSGQKEESLSKEQPDTFGQKETHIGLEIGQKPVSLQNQLIGSSHKREEAFYQKYDSGHLEVGQKEEPEDIGQREVPEDEGQREVPADVGQREVPEHIYYSKHTDEELGKKEVTEDLGQKEESDSFYHGTLDLGQREEPLTGQSQDNIGKEEEKSFFHNSKVVPGGLPHGFAPADSVGQGQLLHGKHYNSKESHGYHNKEHGYHHGVGFKAEQPCEHGAHYNHGEFGEGQIGHNQQIMNLGGTNKHYFINRGDDIGRHGIIHSSSITRRNETVHIQRANPAVSVPSGVQTGTNQFDLDKKVEDLAMLLESEGISKIPTSVVTENTQTSTTPISIHNAEIEELGSENIDIRSSRQPMVTSGTPERRVNVFETHKEEIGYGYPSQKTYSKKHSRHYSMRQESHSGIPEENPEQLGQVLSQTGSGYQSYGGHQSSGGLYSFSQHGYSSGQIGGHSDYPTLNGHRMPREADRHDTIDSFLSELDKEIARENKKGGAQDGYVQVVPQHQYPSNKGGTFTGQTRQTTTTSTSGSSGSSWFKKLGDNISSTYNKAKDKAKEIVSNVKKEVGY